MKALTLAAVIVTLASLAPAQDTNGTLVAPLPAETSAAPISVDVPFVPPPVLVTPAMTSDVVVVDTVIATNTVFTTNRVSRHVQIIATNTTLRRFVIDIDTNQTPTRFTSYMSDGSVITTAAGDVASLSNRPALSTFNGLLRDVVANGHRNANTNAAWQTGGTGASSRAHQAWRTARTNAVTHL